jgi:hypothetical protein
VELFQGFEIGDQEMENIVAFPSPEVYLTDRERLPLELRSVLVKAIEEPFLNFTQR